MSMHFLPFCFLFAQAGSNPIQGDSDAVQLIQCSDSAANHDIDPSTCTIWCWPTRSTGARTVSQLAGVNYRARRSR